MDVHKEMVARLREYLKERDAGVTALLDQLRPIRARQESRVREASRLLCMTGTAVDVADAHAEALGLLQEFIGEMQKAKNIHSRIDQLLYYDEDSKVDAQDWATHLPELG